MSTTSWWSTSTRTRAEESAEDFVREVLVGCLDTRAVVVGHDFHFGYKRRGNVALLQDMGAEFGFDVTGLRLFGAGPGGQPVSSTRIRELLAAGDVAEAAALLGRPHQVRGVVTEGDRRGRELGFPTANVALPAAIALPADGVYAGWYQRPDGARRPAALSLGRRPTFYDEADLSLLEAYLLDFEGDLYGEPARVEFVAHLRGQARFESVDDLIDQMDRDVAATREILGRRRSRLTGCNGRPPARRVGRRPALDQAHSPPGPSFRSSSAPAWNRRWRFWAPWRRLASSRRRCEARVGRVGVRVGRRFQGPGQAGREPVQGGSPVARLRALVAGGNRHDRAEARDQPIAGPRRQAGRRGDVEAHLGPGVGRVDVLAARDRSRSRTARSAPGAGSVRREPTSQPAGRRRSERALGHAGPAC